jgi:hypothetical protein
MPTHEWQTFDQSPYEQGAEARLAGKPETANPFDVETDDHLSWNDGWASIDQMDDED